MSTAFFPQGMSSYNNVGQYQGSVPYLSWKANEEESYPVGVTAGHIRPLTNNDVGNNFPSAFGKARPIKHYRKGTTIPIPIILTDPKNPNNIIQVTRNYNRNVKSSKSASLGGGNGGFGVISQMIDTPGSFIVKQNSVNEVNGEVELKKDCKTCLGVGVVDDYKPNTAYLTENPTPETQTPQFCCNAEKKALRRCLPASTNLKKNYYTTHSQYMQNRCQTYNQRVFNFVQPVKNSEFISDNPYVTEKTIQYAKPGGPLSTLNTYVANCQPNAEIYQASEVNLIDSMINIMQKQNILSNSQIVEFYATNIRSIEGFAKYLELLPNETNASALKIFIQFVNNPYIGIPFSGPNNPIGCKLVVYKPNNSQYAQQGAVSSSTRILKLNVTTIEKNLAGYNRSQKIGADLGVGPAITSGGVPEIPFLYKNKAPYCTQDYFTNFHPQFQNPRTCGSLDTNSSIVTNPTNYTVGNRQSFRPSNHYATSYAAGGI